METMLEIVNTIGSILSLVGIPFLLWDAVRGRFLKATLNGKQLEVSTDEVKEAFRRSALAEASRLAGGRRINLKYTWKNHVLIMEEEN